MKSENNFIQSNENLTKLWMSYLNCKDLSQISQVSRKFNKISEKYFDDYWREDCNRRFCSNYENNKLIENEKVLAEKFESEDAEKVKSFGTGYSGWEGTEGEQWKEKMRVGLEIQEGWLNLEKSGKCEDQMLLSDVQAIQKEVYANLKEYFALPKLRKENCHIESELNTILQTYLYDFLYDQQDLYEYYDEFFYNKKCQKTSILVKNAELPLASSLENFMEVYKELAEDEDKCTFRKLRWYIFNQEEAEVESLKLISKSVNNYSEINIRESILVFDEIIHSKSPQTPLHNEPLSLPLISKLQTASTSRLVFILNCLNLTFTHFCQISYSYIMKYFNNDLLFLNEYTKRYRSYVESATYMNDYLENLNVLVNYSYELINEKDLLNQHLPCFPKFSVLRMMILTWNREVLDKINSMGTDVNSNYPICEKVVSLYSSFLTRELHKMNVVNNEVSSLPVTVSHNAYSNLNTNINANANVNVNTNMSSPFSYNKIKASNTYSNHIFNIDNIYLDDEDNLSIISESTNCSIRNSGTSSINSKIGTGSCSLIKSSKFGNKHEEEDEEFMNVSVLGQMCSLLTDSFTHEYSVFNFNHSSISISDSFKEIEEGFSFSLEKAIKSSFNEKKTNHGSSVAHRYLKEVLNFFKTSELHTKKLINRLKLVLFTKVVNILIDICRDEIKAIFFDDYINGKKCGNVPLSLKDAKDYIKIFGDVPDEKNKEVYDFLYKECLIAGVKMEDELIKYLILFFLKDYARTPVNLVSTIEEIVAWSREFNENAKNKNRQVEKEIKRRNITTVFTGTQEVLLSLSKPASWSFIADSQDFPMLVDNDDPLALGKSHNYEDIPTMLGLTLDL